MRMTFLIFCLVLSTKVLGQIDLSTEAELREQEKAANAQQVSEDFLKGTGIRLSPRYYKGAVLIYDCKDHHYVCAAIEDADECREERSNFISKDRFELPCAPLKAFKDHETCAKEQYMRVHDIADTSWCYNDKKLRF